MLPAYSPDGKHLAFVHVAASGALRVVAAGANMVTDTAAARNLGSYDASWTASDVEVPQWSPASDALLTSGPWNSGYPTVGVLTRISGARDTIQGFPDAPIFLRWTKNKSIVFVRHDRLWQAQFDQTGTLAPPEPLNDDVAFYTSASNDGSILYISEDGLRLRSPTGTIRRLGWPISYTLPAAEPILIRNVRIIDGTGAGATSPKDILIEGGRIRQIGVAGSLSAPSSRTLDAAGRFAIPGLIELHAHVYLPHLLPGVLYFGVTTVRDQGSAIGPLVAYADAIAAGVLLGPRISYGGFQYYSDWGFDEDQGRGVEPEADSAHLKRSVALAQAFGAQHIKTRTFRRWDINARMIGEAHRRGMRATGHCAHLLPLVAAGMDAKEHIGSCSTRGSNDIFLSDMTVYDDVIQLFRAAGIAVVPTISYFAFAARLNEQPRMLDKDTELAAFLMPLDSTNWMIRMNAQQRMQWARAAQQGRESTAKYAQAGVTIGTGTDIWEVPTAVHMELEELVAAGLSPAQAIHAATAAAAKILGAHTDLGTIEPGKWADLILLDANPLVDIRNTRKISQVVQSGRVVDRAALLQMHRQR
jgi:hypothetical protein